MKHLLLPLLLVFGLAAVDANAYAERDGRVPWHPPYWLLVVIAGGLGVKVAVQDREVRHQARYIERLEGELRREPNDETQPSS